MTTNLTPGPEQGAECLRCAGTGTLSNLGASWSYEPGPCDKCNGTGRILTPSPETGTPRSDEAIECMALLTAASTDADAPRRIGTPRTDSEWRNEQVLPGGTPRENWRSVAHEMRDFARALETDLLAARARVAEVEKERDEAHAELRTAANEVCFLVNQIYYIGNNANAARKQPEMRGHRCDARSALDSVCATASDKTIAQLRTAAGIWSKRTTADNEKTIATLRAQLLASTTREERLREALDEVKAITEGLRQPGWADEQSVSASRQQITAALAPESQGEGA